MIIIWCKIFKPALKDYLLLHHFAIGTFSTRGVHIIKYLLAQIPFCILTCVMECDIFIAVQATHFIQYSIIFFFFQLYNSLWVLACSIISFHCFLSCVLCFQLVTPIFLKSFLTSSSQLTLGLPFGLVAYGFHLYMVLATLSLFILSTCPNQLSRLYFMYFTIFSLLIPSSFNVPFKSHGFISGGCGGHRRLIVILWQSHSPGRAFNSLWCEQLTDSQENEYVLWCSVKCSRSCALVCVIHGCEFVAPVRMDVIALAALIAAHHTPTLTSCSDISDSNPDRGKRFFFSEDPDRLWGTPSLLFNEYRGFCPWEKRSESEGDQ